MGNIAIITARGGSKRIPKKNIKKFCGKPIIEYSIEAALESNLFDEVMVSTDSREIAEIAQKCGAKVPFFRSEKNSNDFATTADVLLEVIKTYESMGQKFNTLCCMYPTAPFITFEKLVAAYHEMNNKKGDSVMTVVKYSFPPQRALVINNGKLEYKYPEYYKTRSQDLEPIYHDCGQFYFCEVESLKKYNSHVTPNCIPYIIAEEEVQDIDTESDWNIAEMKYIAFNQREKKLRHEL